MKKLLRIIAVFCLLLFIAFFALKKEDIPVKQLIPKYTTAASHFIPIDGMQVHYRIEGTGKPIVLLHGVSACLQTWNEWTDSLKQYYTVIRLDLPAYGLTGPRPDRDYSFETCNKFLNKFFDALKLDSFALAGNSLGGEIAWKYTLENPERVTKLILVDPGGYKLPEAQRSFNVMSFLKYKWLTNIVSQLDTRYFIVPGMKGSFYSDSCITPERVQLYYDMSMRAGNRQSLADAMPQYMAAPQLDASRITRSTLIQWGKYDEQIDISLAEHFKKIPNSVFIVYDQCGHTVQQEAMPQSVIDVMHFLSR